MPVVSTEKSRRSRLPVTPSATPTGTVSVVATRDAASNIVPSASTASEPSRRRSSMRTGPPGRPASLASRVISKLSDTFVAFDSATPRSQSSVGVAPGLSSSVPIGSYTSTACSVRCASCTSSTRVSPSPRSSTPTSRGTARGVVGAGAPEIFAATAPSSAWRAVANRSSTTHTCAPLSATPVVLRIAIAPRSMASSRAVVVVTVYAASHATRTVVYAIVNANVPARGASTSTETAVVGASVGIAPPSADPAEPLPASSDERISWIVSSPRSTTDTSPNATPGGSTTCATARLLAGTATSTRCLTSARSRYSVISVASGARDDSVSCGDAPPHAATTTSASSRLALIAGTRRSS